MNSANFDQNCYNEVVGRQDSTVSELRTLEGEKTEFLAELQKRAGLSPN
jgi:hypothetical protein